MIVALYLKIATSDAHNWFGIRDDVLKLVIGGTDLYHVHRVLSLLAWPIEAIVNYIERTKFETWKHYWPSIVCRM